MCTGLHSFIAGGRQCPGPSDPHANTIDINVSRNGALVVLIAASCSHWPEGEGHDGRAWSWPKPAVRLRGCSPKAGTDGDGDPGSPGGRES